MISSTQTDRRTDVYFDGKTQVWVWVWVWVLVWVWVWAYKCLTGQTCSVAVRVHLYVAV